MTSTHSNSLSTPHHLPFVTPQAATDIHPSLASSAKSGPTTPDAADAASTLGHHFPCHLLQVHAPIFPTSSTTSEHRLTPLAAGVRLPNYYPALRNHIQSVYPLGAHGHPTSSTTQVHMVHGDEDSKTAKPDKFTGRDLSKLHHS